MRTVRVVGDGDDEVAPGDRFVLLKAAGDSWLVRDPDTGRQRYLPADRLERTDEPPLAAVAGSVPDAVRRVLTAVHDDRSLGLLVDLVDRATAADGDDDGEDAAHDRDHEKERAATPVRTLLDATALCESDLHGALAELHAADLVELAEADGPFGGGRAYRPTPTAIEAVRRLRAA